MARRRETPQTVIHARTDPIRIVPLHVPAALALAPSAPPPQLSYRGGPLLTNVEVFTAFWGAAWQQQPQSGLFAEPEPVLRRHPDERPDRSAGRVQRRRKTIGHGERVGTTIITAPVLGHSVSDGAVQHMLQQEILTNTAFPKPNPNTLYFVYLPQGWRWFQGGALVPGVLAATTTMSTGRSCTRSCRFPTVRGCTGGLSTLDALTSTSSHELCEAITDPIPGQGWYDDVHGEIGDICAWKTKRVGAYTVQQEWSNQANACG